MEIIRFGGREGGEGWQKQNFLKESMELNGNFWGGGGGCANGKPSWWGDGYFLEPHNGEN